VKEREQRRIIAAMRIAWIVLVALLGCTPPPAEPKTAEAKPGAAPRAELEKTDLVVGTGAEAKKGSAISVHYVGTLTDGTVFDSSRERAQPFSFMIGQGKVIRGWEQGVIGMKVGGKRKLVVPPHLGYGEDGSPPKIPGNATLIFEIELLHVVE
jgi:FKBP-type peptidyl-prolyl cis-trans isomerase